MQTGYSNLLDLELDDWLDPSLPRMYCKAELESEGEHEEALICLFFGNEFTNENPEFAATTVMPPYLPVQMRGREIILTRPPPA